MTTRKLERRCPRCQIRKPFTEFSFSKRDGLQTYCRDCKSEMSAIAYRKKPRSERYNPKKWRDGFLRRAYGLTPERVDEIRAEQNNKCAICATEFSYERKARGPHIDHDHATGNLRALLCGNCNSGIGMFKDDPDLLYAASEYLSIHKRPLLSLVS